MFDVQTSFETLWEMELKFIPLVSGGPCSRDPTGWGGQLCEGPLWLLRVIHDCFNSSFERSVSGFLIIEALFRGGAA